MILFFFTDCSLLIFLFHHNGDPGFAENSRDLDRLLCELNAYKNLKKYSVCGNRFVPRFYGHIDRLDPAAFQPALQHFVHDKFYPRVILLEYLSNAESLNCENYSDARYRHAIYGMKEIRNAHVHHKDIYPENVLTATGEPEKVVWVDFDVATTFSSMGPSEQEYSEYEDVLVASFGEALVCLAVILLRQQKLTVTMHSETIKDRSFLEIRNSINTTRPDLTGF